MIGVEPSDIGRLIALEGGPAPTQEEYERNVFQREYNERMRAWAGFRRGVHSIRASLRRDGGA